MKISSIREFDIPNTYSYENEALAALIDNPYHITEARKWIDTDTFADANNRMIWETLCKMDSEGAEITGTIVFQKCNTTHYQQNILPYEAGELTPSEVMGKMNALWVAAAKRRAYFAAVDTLKLASGKGELREIYEVMHTFTEKVSATERNTDTIKVAQAVNEYAEALEKRQKDRESGKKLRVPTSFHTLDFVTYGGFANGNLIILAARPSVGKTAVMLQMAREAALNGQPALVFSLEMTNNELVQRMITAVSDIEAFDLANGRVDWSRFDTACGRFADAPLWFNDKAGTLDEIITKITAASRQGNCSIAFIDYLGLISYRDGGRNLYEQVTQATKRLKRLAKDCGIPIVLLCQLNRDMSREGREPQLHDLRDSGSIEQDADIVLMLDRQLSASQDERIVRMFIRKNRQGRVGDCILLEADRHFTNFTDNGARPE